MRRPPTDAEWQDILLSIGPTGAPVAELLAEWIRDQREMCARLQECAQEFKLGLGGERVDELVISEVRRLRNTDIDRAEPR